MEYAAGAGGGRRGDNAAGAVGVGMADAGQAMLSLGTSGVYFAVSEGFLSKPESAVHSFCHALPGRWHLMSVMLSAASCLDWAAKLTGLASVPALIAAAQTADESAGPVWFLPHSSGERTPHNNPQAKGVFWPDASAWAGRAGAGGAGRGGLCAGGWYGRGARLRHQAAEHHAYRRRARSAYWRQMLADISGLQLDYRTGAMSARRWGGQLAQLAVHDEADRPGLLKPLPLEQAHRPDDRRVAHYAPQRETFRQIYQQLKPLMS